MRLTRLSCPSCGGNRLTRDLQGLQCAFCGTRLNPYLEEGMLCGDQREGAACTELAESLCRQCGLPLCDRHNDPKHVYWDSFLGWDCLLSSWDREDAVLWAKVNSDEPRLPVPDLEPDEWSDYLRDSDYAIGRLEDEIRSAVGQLVARAAGEVGEQALKLVSVCSWCLHRLHTEIGNIVSGFEGRYLQIAWCDRLNALEAHIQQGVRYIEAHLERPIPNEKTKSDVPPSFSRLVSDSPETEWEACGAELLFRLHLISRLRDKVPRTTS